MDAFLGLDSWKNQGKIRVKNGIKKVEKVIKKCLIIR